MTPFEVDGGHYVVAGYSGADWAANARAAGAGTLSRAAFPARQDLSLIHI